MKDLLYHHCMSLDFVKYDILIPSEEYTRINSTKGDEWDDEMIKMSVLPNVWLEKEIGFYPLFMSVGSDNTKEMESVYMTGYDFNWRKCISRWIDQKTKKRCSTLRKKGESPNMVMFSFDDIDCTYLDYDYWFIALNFASNEEKVGSGYKRWIFKYSWNKAKWLRKVRNDEGTVMCVVPKLDLRKANRIWVRNLKTKKLLEKMGFDNVNVKKIPVCPL